MAVFTGTWFPGIYTRITYSIAVTMTTLSTFLNNRQATTLPGLLILQFQVQLIAVFNFILYTLSLDFCYISESFLECIVQEISLYIIYDLDGLILYCMLVQLVSENRLVSGLKMIKVQIVMTLKHTFSMP